MGIRALPLEFQTRRCASQQPEVRRNQSSLFTLLSQVTLRNKHGAAHLILRLWLRFAIRCASKRGVWADPRPQSNLTRGGQFWAQIGRRRWPWRQQRFCEGTLIAPLTVLSCKCEGIMFDMKKDIQAMTQFGR